MKNVILNTYDVLSNLRDITLYSIRSNIKFKNPLNAYGRKIFSQSDEDGIIAEIINRIEKQELTKLTCFVEFGSGNGTENNTLALAAQAWKGLWFDIQTPSFKINQGHNFLWVSADIHRSNIVKYYKQCCAFLQKQADFISFDFDGNDYHLVETLLENNIYPKFWCVEYNSKFAPPIEWIKPYEDNCSWDFDDYFGASLVSYVNLFNKHGYTLVCCNGFTGTNAFFIQNKYLDVFSDVPTNINDIWIEPRYYLPRNYGHKTSTKTVQSILNRLNEKVND